MQAVADQKRALEVPCFILSIEESVFAHYSFTTLFKDIFVELAQTVCVFLFFSSIFSTIFLLFLLLRRDRLRGKSISQLLSLLDLDLRSNDPPISLLRRNAVFMYVSGLYSWIWIAKGKRTFCRVVILLVILPTDLKQFVCWLLASEAGDLMDELATAYGQKWFQDLGLDTMKVRVQGLLWGTVLKRFTGVLGYLEGSVSPGSWNGCEHTVAMMGCDCIPVAVSFPFTYVHVTSGSVRIAKNST